MASKESIEIFVRAALSKNNKIVDAAFNALKSSGKEAIPNLKMMLEETTDIHLKERVCNAIAGIGSEAKGLAQILTKMLEDHKEKDTLIVATINALGSIGSPAKDALPELYKFIDSVGVKTETRPEIQIAAIYAIIAIDRES